MQPAFTCEFVLVYASLMFVRFGRLYCSFDKERINMKKANGLALLPIGVFLVLYLGLGILFEYGMGITMGFYSIPIVVVFLVALLVAILQNKRPSLNEKFEIMGRGIGDKNIVTMIIVFMLAGIFVGTVGRDSAESVAYFMLDVMPVQLSVLVLFVVSCFVSLAMGTSVGTITLIAPIAFAVSDASGFSLPLCVGVVMGGAMFGDNLSFISDTTIAACQGQGCEMKDKFRANFKIAIPAALASLVIVAVMTLGNQNAQAVIGDYNLIELIPYILVLFFGVVGVNVFIVLIIGIVSGAVVVLATGSLAGIDLLASMGEGVAGMYETTMVAVMVAAISALIKDSGGFEALLNWIKSVFKGKKSSQLGIGCLVGFLDVATANNTVAIVMANPIASQLASENGISKQRTASLLDIFSCVVQGILPYGAQMLVAITAVASLGGEMSAFQVIPYTIYPFALLVCILVFIYLVPEKKVQANS